MKISTTLNTSTLLLAIILAFGCTPEKSIKEEAYFNDDLVAYATVLGDIPILLDDGGMKVYYRKEHAQRGPIYQIRIVGDNKEGLSNSMVKLKTSSSTSEDIIIKIQPEYSPVEYAKDVHIYDSWAYSYSQGNEAIIKELERECRCYIHHIDFLEGDSNYTKDELKSIIFKDGALDFKLLTVI